MKHLALEPILELNPKFAVLKKLCLEDMEQDVEICKAKLRYEKRRRDEIIREREIYETEYGEVSNNKRRKLEITEEEKEEDVIRDARSRQFYDPSKRVFNYSKKRVTDLEENKSVMYLSKVNLRSERIAAIYLSSPYQIMETL